MFLIRKVYLVIFMKVHQDKETNVRVMLRAVLPLLMICIVSHISMYCCHTLPFLPNLGNIKFTGNTLLCVTAGCHIISSSADFSSEASSEVYLMS